ncbi:uncharacterized protein JN550_001600 [Neoarthrinium moseri]|uniref:uncharacterized protein n=1 Tax=Neoarthrinium moseri TaxID=1658444 RepID=UPI001FDD73DD|nr:uncharacterized protein JN550_001600 [Neoarthrinium moseri]KAI1876104.1 hypothetical protein JN550_001600 [Neoarthrinium moseri]
MMLLNALLVAAVALASFASGAIINEGTTNDHAYGGLQLAGPDDKSFAAKSVEATLTIPRVEWAKERGLDKPHESFTLGCEMFGGYARENKDCSDAGPRVGLLVTVDENSVVKYEVLVLWAGSGNQYWYTADDEEMQALDPKAGDNLAIKVELTSGHSADITIKNAKNSATFSHSIDIGAGNSKAMCVGSQSWSAGGCIVGTSLSGAEGPRSEYISFTDLTVIDQKGGKHILEESENVSLYELLRYHTTVKVELRDHTLLFRPESSHDYLA